MPSATNNNIHHIKCLGILSFKIFSTALITNIINQMLCFSKTQFTPNVKKKTNPLGVCFVPERWQYDCDRLSQWICSLLRRLRLIAREQILPM